MAATLLERLFRRQQKRTDSQGADWQQVVRDLADGRPIADDRLDEILESLGKSPEQLQADVDQLTRRRAAAVSLAALAKAEAEIESARDESQLANDELRAAQKRCDAASRRFRNATATLIAASWQADEGRRLLLATCDEALRERIAAFEVRLAEIGGRDIELTREIERLTDFLRELNEAVPRALHPLDVAEREGQAATGNRDLERARQELGTLAADRELVAAELAEAQTLAQQP